MQHLTLLGKKSSIHYFTLCKKVLLLAKLLQIITENAFLSAQYLSDGPTGVLFTHFPEHKSGKSLSNLGRKQESIPILQDRRRNIVLESEVVIQWPLYPCNENLVNYIKIGLVYVKIYCILSIWSRKTCLWNSFLKLQKFDKLSLWDFKNAKSMVLKWIKACA